MSRDALVVGINTYRSGCVAEDLAFLFLSRIYRIKGLTRLAYLDNQNQSPIF
jgi:hypothetical protein